MKWIQASIRLPLFSHRLISRFIHTQTPMFDFKDWALNNPDKLQLVEWLDESASLPSSSVTGEVTGKTKEQCLKDRDVSIDRWPDTRDLIYLAMDDYAKQFRVTGESEAINKAIIEELQSLLSSGVHSEYLPEKINDRISELKGDKSYT